MHLDTVLKFNSAALRMGDMVMKGGVPLSA